MSQLGNSNLSLVDTPNKTQDESSFELRRLSLLFLNKIIFLSIRGGYGTDNSFENVSSAADLQSIIASYVDAGTEKLKYRLYIRLQLQHHCAQVCT